MWEVKHCSVSQFPHQEKWKQFVLLLHLNPGNFQNRDGLKITESSPKTRQVPSPHCQRHLTQGEEKIKSTGPGAASSPSCLSGCHKTNSHWVGLGSATCSPRPLWAWQPPAALWHLGRGRETLPRGMWAMEVHSLLKCLTQLQL